MKKDPHSVIKNQIIAMMTKDHQGIVAKKLNIASANTTRITMVFTIRRLSICGAARGYGFLLGTDCKLKRSVGLMLPVGSVL